MTTTPETPADPYPWLPLTDVLERIKLLPESPKVPVVERQRKAAAAQVQRLRRDLMTQLVELQPDGSTVVVGYQFDPTDEVVEAGHLIVARLAARINTPTASSFTELGAAEVARFDPDVAPLLGIGRFGTPRVG